MHDHRADQPSQPVPEPSGIVSVNSRGGTSNGRTAKAVFTLLVAGMLIVGAVMAVNKSSASKHAAEAARRQTASDQSKPAEPGKRRIFSTDPPPLPGAAAKPAPVPAGIAAACPDGSAGQPLLGPDGKPMTAPSGQAIRVCPNGQVIVPGAPPLPGAPASPNPAIAQGAGQSPSPGVGARESRYGGDVIVPTIGGAAAPTLDPNNPYIQALLRAAPPAATGADAPQAPASPAGMTAQGPGSAGAQGSINDLLTGSGTKAVSATLIGNRDMILPEGRSIDCNLSVRIVNDVSGKATCVLSSNVYSDNGKVVLAERGSTAVGEYVATSAQGQRRLFILWTRLQTPSGVVVNVNSPAADALGTSGLPGQVDNRWPERIGAAVLLSLVEDGIGYATAKAASENGGGGAQGVAVFQSTTQAGRTLAERILDSTINIKPTIYKHQGDRATIFVSRDLDFGGVYALRAQ